jgi:FlaA1/EpsC-like NDP-sugar epimerase
MNPRLKKQIFLLIIDVCLVTIAFLLTFYIRLGSIAEVREWVNITHLFFTVFFSILYFIKVGIYHTIIRFMGSEGFFNIAKAVSISTVIYIIFAVLTQTTIPRSTPFIYWAISLVLISGIRYLIWRYYTQKNKTAKKITAIYGSGKAGRLLLKALKHNNQYKIVLFIDDNKAYQGSIIDGLMVYPAKKLEQLVTKYSICNILLAIPSISIKRRKEIIISLEKLSTEKETLIEVKKVPDLHDIVSGKEKIESLKSIDINDLLGRSRVEAKEELFSKCIKEKQVMVTGAGGSIGSELCRQIIKHRPIKLILLEQSEYALYQIEQELNKITPPSVKIVALLGSVQNQHLLTKIMSAYSIKTVYHAAAYKHVPIVEENIVEGIKNNIFGTYYTAKAAMKSGVENFILISTDKAVRPTNIMGATKRFAEQILQALTQQQKNKKQVTIFSMVRFGNVLGSSGSVVPLFTKQIRQGGPVTVTHPDITRFFMTIPEASELVLQASTMSKGGEVFVLDMGEPIKIADLAKKMIHLHGLTIKNNENPEGDIEIQYTALRPGEKLYEELLIGDNVIKTSHQQIMRAEEKFLPYHILIKKLSLMEKSCDELDIKSLYQELLNSDLGYQPVSPLVSDLLWRKTENNDYVKVT